MSLFRKPSIKPNQHFIPFQFPSFVSRYYEPLTQDRKKWLRQRKEHQYESYQEQLKPAKLEIEQTTQKKFYDNKYIRYCVNREQVKYITDSQLSAKTQREMKILQAQKDKKDKKDDKQMSNSSSNVFMNKFRYFSPQFCRYCKNNGHCAQNCNKRKNSPIYMAAYICYHCNNRGHISKHCPAKQYRQQTLNQFDFSSGTEATPRKGLIIEVTPPYPQPEDFDY